MDDCPKVPQFFDIVDPEPPPEHTFRITDLVDPSFTATGYLEFASAAWKHETCETCEFRVDKLCRAGPAARLVAGPEVANGPVTYEPACAQWKRAATAEKEKDNEQAS